MRLFKVYQRKKIHLQIVGSDWVGPVNGDIICIRWFKSFIIYRKQVATTFSTVKILQTTVKVERANITAFMDCEPKICKLCCEYVFGSQFRVFWFSYKYLRSKWCISSTHHLIQTPSPTKGTDIFSQTFCVHVSFCQSVLIHSICLIHPFVCWTRDRNWLSAFMHKCSKVFITWSKQWQTNAKA